MRSFLTGGIFGHSVAKQASYDISTVFADPEVVRLSKLIAIDDMRMPQLQNAAMTRSSFHSLAFFMVWPALDGTGKLSVLNKLREHAAIFSSFDREFAGMQVADLDQTVKAIQWQSLFQHFPEFARMEMADIGNYKACVRKNSPELYSALSAYPKVLHQTNDPNSISFFTKVFADPKWRKPFIVSGDTWKVPEFEIEGLLPTTKFENDFIRVEPNDPNKVEVRMLNRQGVEEKIVKMPKTELDSDVYGVFQGEHIGNFPVSMVRVFLEGSTKFNITGASVQQTQEVRLERSAPTQRPTTITIKTPVLLFGGNAGVQAIFNDGQFELNNSAANPLDQAPNFRIKLATQDPKNAVWVMPRPLTSLEVTHQLIEAHEKSRLETADQPAVSIR